MKKFLGIISALLLAACTDYVDDFEGKYEKTLGSEEAFLEGLNKNEWEWNKVCNSGDWFWCYNTEDGYNSKNDGIIKEYSTGSATILFTKTNDKGYENVVNELGSDLLPILRHDGGIGFSMFGGRDGDHVGVKVPISNFDIFKENNLLLAYENGCSGATINLVVEAGKNYMFRGSEIKAGTPIFQFSKEVPVSGYQVLEFNPDKFDVEVGETNWIMVDDILKNEGSGKYATYVSVDLSKDCPDDKKIVLVGVGIKPYTRNVSKSSSSSNGGSSVKSSSSNKGETTTSSSSTEKIELAKNAVTCEPEVGQIKVGESVKWKFTMSSETIKLIPEIDRMAIHSAWTFEGADKSSSAKDGPSTVSYDITYSTTGTKKATLDFTAGKYHGTYTCSTLNVVASGISSSSIAKSSSSSAKSGSSVASSSSTVQGFLWDGSDLKKFVKTDFGTGTDWYSFTDAKDDGGSTTINPQNPVDSLFDICWGNCGMVHYGSDYVNPYASTGFDLDNQGKTYDVSDWEGLCIAYESDAPVILRLTPSKATAGDYGYDFPEKTLPASQSGAVNIMSFAWDKFLQNGWSDTKISGEEIAKILKGVEISFRGTAGESQYFNIRQVGSKGKCSPQLNPRDVDMALFDKYPDAVVTAIAESDVIWYGGSKLNGEDSYLKQALFATELPWVSDSAKKYIKWNPKIEGNVVSDRLVKLCGGGVCGTVGEEEIPDNAYLDVGFPVADSIDISGWGGVCLTYSTDSDSLKLYLGLGDEEGGNGVAIGFDWYHVYLAPSASDTTVCIPWQNFVQGGYGTAVKLDWYLPRVKDVSFEIQHKAGTKFNISAVGTYKDNVAAFNEYMKDKNNSSSAWPYLNPALADKYDTIIDSRDGQVYKIIEIGKQTWMAENLNYDTTGSRCYGDSLTNCAKFGRLYTWDLADKACPAGWRLPSKAEWQTLINAVGGSSASSKGIKSSHPLSGWDTEYPRTDSVGFSSLPGGEYNTSEGYVHMNNYAYLWTATINVDDNDQPYAVYWNGIENNGINISYWPKEWAFSVRCVEGSLIESAADFLNPDAHYELSMDRRDQRLYRTVKIGDQTWMAQNMDYDKSGECFNGDSANCTLYGRLYTFEEAKSVCPAGWHLPTKKEYQTLLNFVGGADKAGPILRSTVGWYTDGNTDAYGFSAAPAGNWQNNGNGWGFLGDEPASVAHFWTSTEYDDGAYVVMLTDGTESVQNDATRNGKNRLSVRCLYGNPKPTDFMNSTVQYDSITDTRDGQVYKTVEIGNQTWMAQNLNLETAGSYCYANDTNSCTLYGRLYTWGAAMDSAGTYSNTGKGCGKGKTCTPLDNVVGICPDGFHLPSKVEFDTLLSAVGGSGTSASLLALKSAGLWSDDGGENSSGFTALPAGYRADLVVEFNSINDHAYFWSATGNAYTANLMELYYNSETSSADNASAFSVRCVKTEPIPTTIKSTDLIWYGGNKLADPAAGTYLKQQNLLSDYVWISGSAETDITFSTPVASTIPDSLIAKCGGGICGRVGTLSEEAYIGFDVDNTANLEEWGGVCLTYTATDSDIIMYLGTGGGADTAYSHSIGWNLYHVKLPVANTPTTKCFSWLDDFKQYWDGSNEVKLDAYLPHVRDLSFRFTSDADGAKFNIIAIGTYKEKVSAYNTHMQNKSNRTSAWDYLSEAHASDYVDYTDERDGQVYKTIQIGEQTWMAENMNYKTTTDSYCYDDDSLNCNIYGRLYTWDAAMDACPDGWVLPSVADFETLVESAGGLSNAGSNLKVDANLWSDGMKGVDEYAFAALPAGYLANNSVYYDLSENSIFWSSNETDGNAIKALTLNYGIEAHLNIQYLANYALSVRCIKGGSKYNAAANTLTDFRDGKVYRTVEIGDQVWMAENLNYRYLGGTADLPDSSSFCYKSNSDSCDAYGRLYIWSAAMDSAGIISGNRVSGCGRGVSCTIAEPMRGVCPVGWHIPTNAEWETLFSYVGDDAGKKLKSSSGWTQHPDKEVLLQGTDDYNFTVLPVGYRYTSGTTINSGKYVFYWTPAPASNSDIACYVHFNSWSDGAPNCNYTDCGQDKRHGFPIRCVKD